MGLNLSPEMTAFVSQSENVTPVEVADSAARLNSGSYTNPLPGQLRVTQTDKPGFVYILVAADVTLEASWVASVQDDDGTKILNSLRQHELPNTDTIGEATLRVNAGPDAPANGTELIAAVATATSANPRGSAKSKNNRFTIEIGPGSYSLGTSEIYLPDFVDLKGLGADKLATTIYTDHSTGSVVSVGNSAISNLELQNITGAAYSGTAASMHTYAWSVLRIRNGDTSTAGKSLVKPYISDVRLTVPGTHHYISSESATSTHNLSGHLVNVEAWSSGSTKLGSLIPGDDDFCEIDLVGGEYGLILDGCIGGQYSFLGHGGGRNNGIIKNCIGGDFSFIGSNGQNHGEIINCIGEDYSFGFGGLNFGLIQGCKAKSTSFVYSGANEETGIITACVGSSGLNFVGRNEGIISNCTSGGNSFCYFNTNRGILTGCRATTDSFCRGSENRGVISNCTGGTNSFVALGDNYGIVTGCTSLTTMLAQGHNRETGIVSNCSAADILTSGTNSGRVSDCVATSIMLHSGTNNASGVISNCKIATLLDNGGDNYGIIQNCDLTFSNVICNQGILAGKVISTCVHLGWVDAGSYTSTIEAAFYDCDVRLGDPGILTTFTPVSGTTTIALLDRCRIDDEVAMEFKGVIRSTLAELRSDGLQLIDCHRVNTTSTSVYDPLAPETPLRFHPTNCWAPGGYGS